MYHQKLIVDLFAGGGGMSTAIEQAIGRSPDIAVNHAADALNLHRANHPATRHFIADVWEIDPRWVTKEGRAVGLLHCSSECTHHSQAKGGQPRDQKSRSLTWVAKRWAGQVLPDIITLENVRQILDWGPLIAKRDAYTGRVVKLDGTTAKPGERVPVQQQHLAPDPKRKGITWRRFVAALHHLGYRVEWRMLNAADFGAPTTRERLFMVARRDGMPIEWPEPTHQPRAENGKRPWRSAAGCIDWGIPCRSIFDREKPLAENTLKRIAAGIAKFVLTPHPFLVPSSQNPASAYVMQANGGHNVTLGRDPRQPLTVITTRGSQQQLVTACLAHLRGNCDARDAREPLRTISAGGAHHGVIAARVASPGAPAEAEALRIAAFLMRYHGSGGQWSDPRDPATTMTTRDRLALVTVHIQGEPYVIVDIGLRMLTPRELFHAQGFPDDYIIDRGVDGRPLSKAAQVRLVGNSVSPPPAMALIQANAGDLAVQEWAKAG